MFDILDNPTFSCSACGSCCSKLQGFASDAERAFIEEMGQGQLPLISLVPPEEMTFPLWDFEAHRFLTYAKELGIDAKIRPYRGVFDLDSNQLIIVCYHIATDRCTYLKDDGKCAIYGKERAFVCNLYPLNRSPFLNVGQVDDASMFGSCAQVPGIVSTLDFKDKGKLVSQLHHAFGNALDAAAQHDHLLEWSNREIIELMKAKKIRPAMNYPYNLLLKRIRNSDHIDFTDFLVECGKYSREEMDALIERFRSYADGKEKIEQVLHHSRS